MTKFDEIYRDVALKIINEGHMQKGDVRPRYADGTPAYTKYIRNVNFEIKPEDGFPILQSKRVPWKTFFKEIDWIFRQMSNDVNALEDMGVKVWSEWAIPRRSRDVVMVEKKEYTGVTNFDELKPVRIAENVKEHLGVFESNSHGKYFLLEDNKEEGTITVQFCDTGYKKTVGRAALFTKGISDPYFRSYKGIGYLGNNRADDILEAFGPFYKRWMSTWHSMVSRCKQEPEVEERNVKYYKDVEVSEEFQSCENFLRWVYQNNPYGQKELGILQLDKDYYGSRIYSPETCILLLPEENKALARKKWIIEDGKLYYSIAEFAREMRSRIPEYKWITDVTKKPTKFAKDYINKKAENGEIEFVNPYDEVDGKLIRFSTNASLDIGRSYGWQLKNKKYPVEDCRYIDDEGEEQVEYKYLNQVEYIIHEITNNPRSRRIMTNLLDIDDVHEMPLFPCVFLTHWQVDDDDKLHLSIVQRSGDWSLGIPSNLVEYALLHRRIAQITGKELGSLYWTVLNAHIYDRHIPLLEEQVTADISHLEKTVPQLILPKSLDYFNTPLHEAEVVNYKHNGTYKYEIAI